MLRFSIFALRVIIEKNYILADNEELFKACFLSSVLFQEWLKVTVLQKLKDHHVWILVNDYPNQLNLKN